MTPNPNPSPELLPCPNPWCHSHRGGPVVRPYVHGYTGGYCRVRCPVCPQIGPDGKTPDEAIAAWNTRSLSQTLPAPGEDRTDAQLLRLIAKDHTRLAPNAYHSAETLVQIADRIESLATVAAANDEAFARGIEAAAKVADAEAARLRAKMIGRSWLDEIAEGMAKTADTIAAAIRLLSQGGGGVSGYFDDDGNYIPLVRIPLATSRSQHEGAGR